MAENITLTKTELQDLLLKQSQQNAEAIGASFVEAIKELKKPSPEEQEKLDAAKKRDRQRRNAGVMEAIEVGLIQAREQSYCSHTKENGRHTFAGRVLNNGDASVCCMRCKKEYRWQATNEQRSNGGALFLMDVDYPFHGMSGAVMENMLKTWEQNSPPKMPAQRPNLAQLEKEKETVEANLAKAV